MNSKSKSTTVKAKKYLIFIVSLLGFACKSANAQPGQQVEKLKLSGVPIFGYNTNSGFKLGAMGLGYFPINKKDKVSPASMVGMGGSITTNKTWFVLTFGKLYYAEDRWRTTYAAGYGDSKFQFYNENIINNDGFVNYNTTAFFLYIEQMRNISGRWYAGLDANYFQTITKVSLPGFADSLRDYVGIGIPVTYDSRDNVQYPSKGIIANMRLNAFRKAIGSFSNYTNLDITISKFKQVSNRGVIGANFSVNTALGIVPFEAETIVGGRILRGYSNGKYRGEQVYAFQTEYRHSFPNRLGYIIFAGMGTFFNSGETWTNNDLLPAVGTGIRYNIIPKIHANIGLDIALGKEDYGFYIRYAEAF